MGMPSFEIVLESLGTATNMVKGFLALRSDADRQQFVLDMQAKLLDAQREAFAAADLTRDFAEINQQLEAELRSLQDRSELIATMKRSDGFLYAPDDPDPFCSRCAEVDTKAVHLVRAKADHLRQPVFHCPQCKTEFVKLR